MSLASRSFRSQESDTLLCQSTTRAHVAAFKRRPPLKHLVYSRHRPNNIYYDSPMVFDGLEGGRIHGVGLELPETTRCLAPTAYRSRTATKLQTAAYTRLCCDAVAPGNLQGGVLFGRRWKTVVPVLVSHALALSPRTKSYTDILKWTDDMRSELAWSHFCA
jgi:hypothetical protein